MNLSVGTINEKTHIYLFTSASSLQTLEKKELLLKETRLVGLYVQDLQD